MSKPGESGGGANGAESGGAANDAGSGAAANDAESGAAENAPDPLTPDDHRAVDRVDYDPDYDPTRAVLCEVCGSEMFYTAACKLKCPHCGYTRDCSDP